MLILLEVLRFLRELAERFNIRLINLEDEVVENHERTPISKKNKV